MPTTWAAGVYAGTDSRATTLACSCFTGIDSPLIAARLAPSRSMVSMRRIFCAWVELMTLLRDRAKGNQSGVGAFVLVDREPVGPREGFYPSQMRVYIGSLKNDCASAPLHRPIAPSATYR